MSWNLEEAISYYRQQGAPGDQTALLGLLREVQQECGGSLPQYTLPLIAQSYGLKEPFLNALIRRIPSIRLADTHCLELCGGESCARCAPLAELATRIQAADPEHITLRRTHCMRMCGKGPNLRWDGVLYQQADEALLRTLAGLD